ncbi:hypothetical protein Hsw_2081 [Hymenobacter swuensis DY53]|uniref:Uncharacterized protein n=1 Tax=Hymenobacter swuensis DY53 TaxID=1227739 RepID=W8F4Y5_9BACT|nr:hypothetical protein Hsw_2081 [Hymenobacter swuensis DY53]
MPNGLSVRRNLAEGYVLRPLHGRFFIGFRLGLVARAAVFFG